MMSDRIVDAILIACMMAVFSCLVALIGVEVAIITGVMIALISGVIIGHDGKIDWLSIVGDLIGVVIGIAICRYELIGVF